jgi:hypothetical protein
MAKWLAFSHLTPEARVQSPAGATQLKWRNQLLFSSKKFILFFWRGLVIFFDGTYREGGKQDYQSPGVRVFN